MIKGLCPHPPKRRHTQQKRRQAQQQHSWGGGIKEGFRPRRTLHPRYLTNTSYLATKSPPPCIFFGGGQNKMSWRSPLTLQYSR